MYGLPPLSLPPPIPLTGRRTVPINDNLHIGKEVSFANLVPGKSYFRKFGWGPALSATDNMGGEYEEIELFSKGIDNTGQLTGDYTYFIPYPMRYQIDPKGDPITPMPIPQAPAIQNPFEMPHTEVYDPRYYRFYEVDPVKRGRHMVGPLIKQRLKKNIRRKHLDLTLDKLGLPTNLGTGPSDIIRKMVGLQPPRGSTAHSTQIRRHGGKRRKTRKASKSTK
jgi:hypothetical protein